MKSRLRHAFVVLAALAAVVVLAAVAAPIAGLFLVVADPLRRSDAIFVMEGSTPTRELEAAALYDAGWAPLVVVVRAYDPVPPYIRRLAGEMLSHERAVAVLRHRGVPEKAIVVLDRRIDNTARELAADYTFARERKFERVILVTSPYHTRRAWLIWRARYGDTLPAIVRPTPYEDFRGDRWWRSRQYLELTAHEIFGIANFYLGSPIKTYDRREE
jgi:uncharacterized SAM-binding protein YcdF (DUF218 family)